MSTKRRYRQSWASRRRQSRAAGCATGSRAGLQADRLQERLGGVRVGRLFGADGQFAKRRAIPERGEFGE